MKKGLFVWSILSIFLSIHAQTTIGGGLTGSELLEYVQNNYTPASTMGYNTARDTMYALIDIKDGNRLSCVYTGYTITLDPQLDPSTDAYNQGINCEHTWPQSMGAGDEPQKSDMHHLFPCKSNVNSSRGNDPYAEIPDENTDKWYRNDYYQTEIPTEFIEEYAEKYNPPDPNNEVFEPREDHKGDAARAVFYFNAVYNDAADTNFWNVQKDVLLDWHYYDEVDGWELNRTWMIAEYQENIPNPFVLDSTLARRIWYMDDSTPDTSGTDTLEYNIIINEIMQNPSVVSDTDGEWFEIYNASADTIDLTGFIIKDNGSDAHTISSSTIVFPNSYAVLGRNADSNTNGGLHVDYEYSGFTLANGDDEIIIIDDYGYTIDSIAYDGGTEWPDPTGASMALLEPSLDNSNGNSWVEYDSLTYGDGDYGTPGEPNFPIDIVWDFSLSEPVLEIIHVDYPDEYEEYTYPEEWNPTDTLIIKMELCNNTEFDFLYYPGAVLETLNSYNVQILNPEFWFYMMFANTCDSVEWQVIAPGDYVWEHDMEFLAYSQAINCENFSPDHYFESDTVLFSVWLSGALLSIDEKVLPAKYSLNQNYPNPFNPVTTIQYELPENAFVNIRIYDLNGRLVNTLVSKEQTAGCKAIKWAGVDNNGKQVSAGIYLYEVSVGEIRQVRKMVLLK